MAEYIEREAVLAKCREIAACEWNHRASPVSWADAYEQFAEDVEGITAADVEPVRHGRWLYVDTDTEQFFLCNRCKKKEYWESNYCPNCGGKMDLEG